MRPTASHLATQQCRCAQRLARDGSRTRGGRASGRRIQLGPDGRDETTGEVVIVESQLETSDHGHLGQILTYAARTEPTTIVWVAASFRPEHRAAIDWLNARTDENTRFFGVELGVVRIGQSDRRRRPDWLLSPTIGRRRFVPPLSAELACAPFGDLNECPHPARRRLRRSPAPNQVRLPTARHTRAPVRPDGASSHLRSMPHGRNSLVRSTTASLLWTGKGLTATNARSRGMPRCLRSSAVAGHLGGGWQGVAGSRRRVCERSRPSQTAPLVPWRRLRSSPSAQHLGASLLRLPDPPAHYRAAAAKPVGSALVARTSQPDPACQAGCSRCRVARGNRVPSNRNHPPV